MDFAITLGNLILIWLLVAIAIMFAVGVFLTQRGLAKERRSRTKRPRLTSGETVVFEVHKKDVPFIVTTVRQGVGRRREIVLQDQESYSNERRHDEIPT